MAKAPRPPGAPPRAAVEAGLWLTSRHLTYSGAASSDALRTFDVSAIFVPSIRGEVYPGAFRDAGPLLVGLGGYLDYSHSMALKVKPPSGNTEGDHPATLQTLGLGVLWRVRPLPSSRVTLVPAIGYRSLSLVTSATGGTKITGLPDAHLSGLELRLDVDAPVTDRVAVQGGAGYLWWTSAKDLVKGSEFYSSGSARGFEVEGGVAVRLSGPLSVRGLVEYSATSYTLHPSTGTPQATGAKDTYLGGRVLLRAEY